MVAIPPLWAQLYLLPPVITLLLWGGLTVALIRLNRHGPQPGRIALFASLGLLLLAHQQLWVTRDDLSAVGSYRAFIAGIVIWSWHELAFYSGILTGPWRKPCPPGARGWSRFWPALGTHLYHELAVGLELLVLWLVLRTSGNQVGLLAVLLSWALQHSAKLNVLFGVRYLQVELFPPHLAYLGSFWARRPANPLLLPALLANSAVAIWLWSTAARLTPETGAIGAALLAGLCTLGLLEHLLLVWPGLPAPPPTEAARVVEASLRTPRTARDQGVTR